MKGMYIERITKTNKNRTNTQTRPLKGFVDKRPEFLIQRKLIQGMQGGDKVAQCKLKIGETPCNDIKDVKTLIGSEAWNPNWSVFVDFLIKDKENIVYENAEMFKDQMSLAPIYNKLVEIEQEFSNLFSPQIIKGKRQALFAKKGKIREKKAEIGNMEYLLQKRNSEIKDYQAKIKKYEGIQKGARKKILDGFVREQEQIIQKREKLLENKKKVCTAFEKAKVDGQGMKDEINNTVILLNKYRVLVINDRERATKLLETSIAGNAVDSKFDEIESRISQSLIDVLPKTSQPSNTKQCWFLSIFEGLRRSGLVYPILENLGANSPADWQETLEKKFMEGAGIDKKTPRDKDPKVAKAMLTDFFSRVLPAYNYTQIQLPFTSIDKYEQLPRNEDLSNGVNVTGNKIFFYTIDKPNHAMFYVSKRKIPRASKPERMPRLTSKLVLRAGTEPESKAIKPEFDKIAKVYNQGLYWGQNQDYLLDKDTEDILNSLQGHVFTRSKKTADMEKRG